MKYFLSYIVFTFLLFGIAGNVLARVDEGLMALGGDAARTELAGDAPRTPLVGDAVRDTSVSVTNPLRAENITELFQAIIDILLVFAIPLIVFFIIYAGFMYVTARGNESNIQKAHMALLYALIGGVLILGAKVLIEVIGGTVETFR